MVREMRREVNTGRHLKAGFAWIILQIIILLSVAQKVILIVAIWLFSHGECHKSNETSSNLVSTLKI